MADEHKQQAAVFVERVEHSLTVSSRRSQDLDPLRVALAQVHATLQVADKVAELTDALRER